MVSKKTISAILVGLLVALVFIKRGQKTETKAPLVEYIPEEATIKKIDPSQRKSDQKMEEELMSKRIKLDLKERQMELKRLPLPRQNENSILDVEIYLQPTCRPGDADAIQMDLKAAPNHKVMVTLEPFSKGGTSFQWDLPSDFTNKESLSNRFVIPQGDKPSLWGFYICTGDSRDTSCKEKAVIDINDIFTEHVNKDPQAGRQLRNIFFQLFLLDDWGMVAFSDVPKENKRFEQFKTYAKERGLSAKESDPAIAVSEKNMVTLLSLPFSFSGKKLSVKLPKYRAAACSK
ncbi:MAG: hypothetical protein ACKN9V_03585 [Pseudomonadota bacterium]